MADRRHIDCSLRRREALMKAAVWNGIGDISLKSGNCNHRRYIPKLLDFVRTGRIDPAKILTNRVALEDAIDAYGSFDKREEGWIKVELLPAA
jgi:threonine dehydrogenase-like Zn-dependent dehydrogenase